MMARAGVRGRLGPALGLAAAIVLSALPGVAGAAERVALVIGNGAYAHVKRLPNPGNDAADMGAALERLGFTVTRVADADQATLRQRLGDFTRAAGAAEVAVVFYAGHGIEVDGRNFLVPVDAKLQSDQDVEFEAVPLELVMRSVERARGLRLVVLDACRDNPFAARMQSAGATRSIGRGLARVEPRGETLVAYAAKGGSVAADGDGRNSPYTGALLRYLEEPGMDVGRLFRNVRDEVLAATGGRQEPFVYGSLPGRDVYLASAAAPPPPPPPPPGGAKAAYEAAERVGTVAVFQAVVKRFPDTFEAELAQAQIEGLEKPVVAPEEVERRLELDREEYRLVQKGLAAAGHGPGAADGRIGSGTREAIRRWQGSRGEPETGYLDADGAKALMGLGREHEALRRFTELLGRPFSAEFKTDSSGWTDLHYAALLDLPGVVAALCDAGMAADTRLKGGSFASFDDDLEQTFAALGYRVEFEDRTPSFKTPLMIAAEGNARKAAAELVACGADVNARAREVVRSVEFDSGTPLSYAAWRNFHGVARLLIEHGADVNVGFWNGSTPLHSAASNNSLEMAKLLIKRGANVNARTDYFRDPIEVPLNHAASNNSLEMARLLIEHGADVDLRARSEDDIILSPLHSAASNNSLEMAKLLIEHGADVNARENMSGFGGGGSVPLHVAAENNSLEMAKLLLDRGADVNATDDDGGTLLHSAAANNALDVAKLLLDRGADLNATDNDGQTPLDIALNRGHSGLQTLLREFGGMDREQHEALRRFTELIGRPFSAEYKTDAEGWTDMHYAALLDLPGVVTALCDAGMDADTRLKSGSRFSDDLKRTLAALGHENFKYWSADGQTPLMIASYKKAYNAAAGLAACGADVNATGGRYGGTVLHFATWGAALDVAKLLLDRGADINATDDYGRTPLFHPANYNYYDIVKLLIDRGADVNAMDNDGGTPLLLAFFGVDGNVTKLLIDHGADGATPLHAAVSDNQFDLAERLIARGADVNAKTTVGVAPLHLAVARNSFVIVNLLLDRGADVNATGGRYGDTPLHKAASWGRLDMARLLLDRGADVNATNDWGGTPLEGTAVWNQFNVAKLLLDRGADVNATNDGGETPLDRAFERGSSEMQVLLREAGGVCKKNC